MQVFAAKLAEVVEPYEKKSAGVRNAFVNGLAALSIEIDAGVLKIKKPSVATQNPPMVVRAVLAGVLTEAARMVAARDKAGLVVLFDEMQEVPREQMSVLLNAIQDSMKSAAHAPLAVFAAGLPTTPERMINAASFAERADFQFVDSLGQHDATRALLEPSLQLGVRWQPEAVEAVMAQAAGVPFLLQRYGYEAWLLANPEPGDVITTRQAQQAIDEVRRASDHGMFRGRWERCANHEQGFLTGMATVMGSDGFARISDIAAALGKTGSQLSMARKSLVDKGFIKAASRGQLCFTIPGFSKFVLDQDIAATELDSLKVTPEVVIANSPGLELPVPRSQGRNISL